MESLDFYLNTPDEHFNEYATKWYYEFKRGEYSQDTDKPFELFIRAFNELFFFVKVNYTKQFTCNQKLDEIADLHGFNEAEKRLIIGKLTGCLFTHEDNTNYSLIIAQFMNYGNDINELYFYSERKKIKVYSSSPIYQIVNWGFDFEGVKTKLKNKETLKEKQSFLVNLLFNFKQKEPQMGYFEKQYYENMGLLQWIEVELQRCDYENKIDAVEVKNLENIKETLSHLITHPTKGDQIVEGIKIQYKNIKGKRLKLLLKALQDLNLLPKDRIAKKFYDCCKAEFGWEIASYNAMNGYVYNELTDDNELNDMKQYINSLTR